MNELFADFEPDPAAQWKLRIQAELRGGDYNELMTRTTAEGIRTKPFYTKEDLPEDPTEYLRTGAGWNAGMYLDPDDGGDPAGRIETAMAGGIHNFLVTVRSEAGWLAGVAADTAAFWLDWRDIHLDPGAALPAEWSRKALLLPDPVGHLAETGNWSQNRSADLVRLCALCGEHPDGVTVQVRSDVYQQAGADCVQQLAYAISHAQEYLLLADENPSLSPALENPVFRVACGSDYFMEIAKIRALRRLWHLLASQSGLSGRCRILAMPGLRNKTIYDYNTNMLRTTLECMAAATGGADLVCNQPYDTLYHKPNAFADRIARNQLLILKEEAYFSKIANPADGSYYIESLTDQLGRKALELFKNLEKGGGMLRQLKEHKIQKKIRESARLEQAAFDSGDRVLVGSNVFPNPDDRMAGDLEKNPESGNPGKTLIEPLRLRRLARQYEKERLRDEAR